MQRERESETKRKVGNALDASNAKRNFTLRLADIVNRRASGDTRLPRAYAAYG